MRKALTLAVGDITIRIGQQQEPETQLHGWAEDNGARLPVIPPECEQAYHMFYMLLPSREHRDGLIEHLKRHGILSVFHYVPLHTSPAGKRFAAHPDAHCPVTEDISDRLLRLPFYNDLQLHQQEEVVSCIRAFRVRPEIWGVYPFDPAAEPLRPTGTAS